MRLHKNTLVKNSKFICIYNKAEIRNNSKRRTSIRALIADSEYSR